MSNLPISRGRGIPARPRPGGESSIPTRPSFSENIQPPAPGTTVNRFAGGLGGTREQVSQSTSYTSLGDLTSQHLLTSEDGALRFLDPHVLAVSKKVQDLLTERGETELLAKARKERGKESYNEMMKILDSLILQELSKQEYSNISPHKRTITALVVNEIIGLGPLEPLWKDPSITEIIVDGPDRIVVEMGGKLVRVPGAKFRDQGHLLSLCQTILSNIGKRIDPNNPLEDGRLPDKSRINVVHQAVAPDGPLLTIRRHRDEAWTVKELISKGAFTEDMLLDLDFWIYGGCSTLVLGGTGSGKTTVLNALSGLIPEDQRVITIEDNLELQLHPDRLVASMEAKPGNMKGDGKVTIRDLVKNSLRMRPNRIVVGEVRDAAAFDMLQAMNTGHNGSMTTFHANGAEEAIDRLSSMVMQSGELDYNGVLSLIAGAVDLLVVVQRFPEDGSRRISGIYEIPSRVITETSGERNLHPIPLWLFVHDKTEDGVVIGHYEKVSDISDNLTRKYRLNQQRHRTLEEIYRASDTKIKASH